MKKILQAQIIDSELTAKLLGRGVAVSPVVTVEPRRRKFHKAITLSMPAPRPHTQGMTNQYSTSSAPTLRLLCSISGTIIIVRLYIKCRSVLLLGYSWTLLEDSTKYFYNLRFNVFVRHLNANSDNKSSILVLIY